MASITFDEIVEAVDKEYDHLHVEFDGAKVTFRNVLQLAKTERELIGDLLKSLSSEDEQSDDDPDAEQKADDEATMKEILKVAAQEKDECDKLLNQIGDNAARLLHVFKLYIGATEVPEA